MDKELGVIALDVMPGVRSDDLGVAGESASRCFCISCRTGSRIPLFRALPGCSHRKGRSPKFGGVYQGGISAWLINS